MKKIKDLMYPIFGIAFIIICIIVAVLDFINTNKKQPPLTNENQCAEFIYYDPQHKNIDTAYSNVVMYGDSLVNFTSPMGITYSSRDIIDEKDETEDDEDGISSIAMRDITVSNGERFKITFTDDTLCRIKINSN